MCDTSVCICPSELCGSGLLGQIRAFIVGLVSQLGWVAFCWFVFFLLCLVLFYYVNVFYMALFSQ